MDIKHALEVAGQAIAFASLCLTALLSAVGTLRNIASHANFISVQERGKIGAFLDRFALVCEKGKKGLVWVLSLPGFASQDKPSPGLAVVPLLLAGVLAVQGCAQYSACVKAQMGPTLKAVTAAEIENQVSAILTTAADQQWVQVGIQSVADACQDTNCKALISCATQAWLATHPAAKPAVKAAAQAYLDGATSCALASR